MASGAWRVGLCALLLAAMPPGRASGVASPAAPAQPLTAQTRIAAAPLLADVDVLERAYRALHPGLARYNTPAQLDASFARLRAEFAGGATLAEAYLAYSRFAATIRCGHTYANFYNQSGAVAAALLQSPTRVPFRFRWVDGEMVVLANDSADASLVPGTRVLALEGVPTREILRAMLPLARADGGNDAKRIASLEVRGNDRYEAFDVFLPWLFPQVDGRQALRVQSPGDRAPREVTVAALTQAQRLAVREAGAAAGAARAEADATAPAWSSRVLDGGVVLLDMPTWALYDSRWDWKAWLQAWFESDVVRAAPALVIDLRRNEGGLDVGNVLLAHLVDAPLDLPGVVRKTRYRRIPADLRPYLDTWDRAFDDWGDQVTPVADGFYRLQRPGEPAEGERIAPVAPRYRGRVFVLVGADNSSATFEFARAVQQARLGTLVGQPTGGSLRGINGGAFYFLRLPGSGIELDLPLVAQFPTTPQPDAGLRPDLPVPVTVADIAGGRDAELAAALAAAHAPR
jgi:hypothetical protein